VETYKKGTIKLIPDSMFGEKTDWASAKFHKIKSFAIADNGVVFAAVINQHKICKFNSIGNFLFQFSQKGEGPGDTYYPSKLSILDNKYLIVNEYATKRKISLFHFDGKIHKVIKNRNSVLDSIGLKGNQIAIVSIKKHTHKFRVISIDIKNYLTGESKKIIEAEYPVRMLKASGSIIMASDLMDKFVIARTKEGNLIVGSNYKSRLQVFSANGRKIRTIPLKITPNSVDNKVIERYEKSNILAIMKFNKNSSRRIKEFKSAPGKEKLFSKTLPLFSDIIVDSQGNILLFYFHFFGETESPDFQVYSPVGDYICDCRIDLGEFKENTDVLNFSRNLMFHQNNLYCIVKKSDGDDVKLQIIKIQL
jgi:hypothetical protein